nr:ABC-type transport auxiliary lipoprotein family protein [Aromatoleum toluvorans]
MIVTVLLASACSVLPRPDPVDTYLLPSAPVSVKVAADGARLPVSLRVLRPSSGQHLAGQRIVVVPQDNLVSVYKGVSWSEPAPLLVRDRLLDALRGDGRIAALSNDETRVQADFEIASDLRAFQSEYRNGVPEVVIRLDARLVQRDERRIVASRLFEIRESAPGKEVPQVVTAFGAASTRLAGEVSEWAVDEIGRVRRSN